MMEAATSEREEGKVDLKWETMEEEVVALTVGHERMIEELQELGKEWQKDLHC